MAGGQHLELTLVLLCVALAALFGLTCAFDDGDLGGALHQTEAPWCSPDELSSALPATNLQRLLTAPAAQPRLRAATLLAAVPGGLCLLD